MFFDSNMYAYKCFVFSCVVSSVVLVLLVRRLLYRYDSVGTLLSIYKSFGYKRDAMNVLVAVHLSTVN